MWIDYLKPDPLRIAFGTLSATLLGVGLICILRNYARKKYRASLYMGIGWSGFMLEAAFYAMKYFFLKESEPHLLFNLLENMSLVPGFLGMLALIDSVSRDAVDPRKFSAVMLVLGADAMMFILLFNNSSLVIVPTLIVISVGLVVGLAWLYFCIMIYKKVPASLKRPALVNVLGALLVSVLYVVTNKYVSGLSAIFPSLDRMLQSIGALLHAITFARHDPLYYVLPFKTQHLVTFDTRNGIALYRHSWHVPDRMIDEDLFSSVLQGMGVIIHEALKKGNLEEIKMENGYLLIRRHLDVPIASVLVTTKPSRVLRDALAAFNQQFVNKYSASLSKNVAIETFKAANSLVKACFSFIPDFD
ncbi:MAG: hypothetical protein GYA24_06685 [Candidatus Lokiarchaeota archaeon]|nr:hypothetical protein [Candidatus Lokiarchaeota archaeon]